MLALLKTLGAPLLIRLCILTVVWGGAVFGSASVVRQIVQSKLPGFEGYIHGYVLSYQQALLDTTGQLDDLLADTRLHEALAAQPVDDAGIHRVLYEYRYLHPESQLWLRDLMRGTNFSVEGGGTLDPALLASLQTGHSAQWLTGDAATPVIITARPLAGLAPGQQVAGLLARPLGEVFKNLAPSDQAESLQPKVSLASRVGLSVWQVIPGTGAKPAPQLSDLSLAEPEMLNGTDTITLIRPLKRVPGWALVIDLPVAAISQTAAKVRTILIVIASLISIALFWRPTIRLAQKSIAPAAGATATSPAGLGPVALLAGFGQRFAALTTPLARAVRQASQGEALIEPQLPPPPQPLSPAALRSGGTVRAGTGSPQPAATPGAVSMGPMAGSPAGETTAGTTYSGGSSVHKKAVRAGIYEGGDTPPPPIEPPAPRLPPEEIRALVKRAIEQDLLQLAYQPIFSTADSLPVMHEVFVRLPGPTGELSALNFLPQAAELGLLPQIDAQVFANVMLTHFANGALPLTPLALNLAGTTMDALAYIQKLEEISDPRVLNHLVFEVRSSELLNDPQAITFLKKCQERGVKLAVDYFGGGKTMLEATKNLGFDYVKINALDFWYDLARRKELVGLARVAAHLQLPMVLEKIELPQMEVMARKIAIPYLQGYHLQRPGPALATAQLASH